MRKVWIAGFLLMVLLQGAYSQSLVIPEDHERYEPPEYPIRWRPFALKEHRVRVLIRDGVAETTIEQLFVNESSVEQEAEYWFSVPEKAAISRFTMTMGDKAVEARLLPAEEARRIYEHIVRRRRDPALLEFAERGLLRARLFPIPPGGERRITFQYTETLRKEGEMTRYLLPLRPARLIARPIGRVRVQLEIRSSNPLTNVYCPSHPHAWVRRETAQRATLEWEARDLLPERDLLVYYSTSGERYDLRVFTYRTLDDGYFLMLLAPNLKQAPPRLPKHLVFVFDRTGSMSGDKIVQAKEAFRYCLRNLQEGDKFNLIYFNEAPTKIFEGLVPATRENVQRAIREVEELTAQGGTNLHDALEAAFQSLPIDRTPALRAVVFLTDGLPTVGETDPERILRTVRELNERREIRLFTFGVGYDVNVHLLDKLCEQNRGAPEYVRPEENIEAKVSNFYNRINLPVLADLRLLIEGVEAYDVYPRDLPDLFQGDQVVVAGRYRGSGRAALVLEGLARQQKERIRHVVDFPSRSDTMDFVPRLWAIRKIGYLIDEWRLHHNEEVKEEIIRLARQYGIVTEFTSFLIEEEMILAEPWRLRERADRPGIGGGGFGGFGGGAPASGAGAVAQSRQLQALQKAGTIAPPTALTGGWADQSMETLGYHVENALVARQAIERLRTIGDRSFYLKGKVWIDSQYQAGSKLIEIEAFSDAYFELLRRYPKLHQYLTLGENVLLQLGKVAVQIGPKGKQQLSQEEWSWIGTSK